MDETSEPSVSGKFLVVLALPGGRLSIRWVSGQYPKKTVRRWRMALGGVPFLVLAAFPMADRGLFQTATGIRALPAVVPEREHRFWLQEAPLDSRWRPAADLQYRHLDFDTRRGVVEGLLG